jgi:BirA family biotin operon repressor/biotin-[acetyl-CoA-carboxylase] ligase
MGALSLFDPRPHLAVGTQAMARTVELHETLSSTNDRAELLAREGAPHGSCVVARAQTAGRGRRGHSWSSPPGAGLYASFVVRPSLAPRSAPLMTLASALAARDALSFFGAPAAIKWPNDLLATGPAPAAVCGRKLCGILLELSSDAARIAHAIIGVGVNLREVERPPEIALSATSLEAVCPGAALPADFTPGRLLARLAAQLEARLSELESAGPAPIVAAFSAAAFGLASSATVEDGDRTTAGILRGIADDGALLLDTATGPARLYTGELHLPGAARPARAPR